MMDIKVALREATRLLTWEKYLAKPFSRRVKFLRKCKKEDITELPYIIEDFFW
jgi:hypothetical protein